MANNMISNGNKKSSDDKVSRIARIIITLVIVLTVGYMVSRMDGLGDGEISSEVIADEAVETVESETLPEQIAEEYYEDTRIEAVPEKEEGSLEEYHFRNQKYLDQHYEKHGIEMGFASATEYERAASNVINNPEALYKTEAEDGDGVYYVEKTNEFVILSTDGYIRTYFNPNGGKAYFDRQ